MFGINGHLLQLLMIAWQRLYIEQYYVRIRIMWLWFNMNYFKFFINNMKIKKQKQAGKHDKLQSVLTESDCSVDITITGDNIPLPQVTWNGKKCLIHPTFSNPSIYNCVLLTIWNDYSSNISIFLIFSYLSSINFSLPSFNFTVQTHQESWSCR